MKRKPFEIHCERCGQPHTVQRVGRFSDEDFVEVFHERMELEARARGRARALHDANKRAHAALDEAAGWRFQAALYRAQLVAAGIAPLDSVEQPEPVDERQPELATAEENQFA